MEIFIKCLLVVACLVLAVECSPDWLERSVRSAEKQRHRRTHKNIDSNRFVATNHHDHEKSDRLHMVTDCCFNGGLCIMNTFCHCPQGYHGQFCEHKTRDRSCGTIEHGTWMARGCFLCHCFDGRMRCKTTRIPNCEFMPFVQAKEDLPDYQVDADTKFADYERFYDMVDEEITNTATSGSGSTLPVICVSSWLERSIRSAESQRHRRAHKNIHSNGFEEPHHHNHNSDNKRATDCCFNGGLCIMNTFCHCQQGYHGRFCEHKTRDRSCGTIEHGTWMARGCFLCHCFDGRMRCKTTRIPNCGLMPFVQAKEELPDYQVDVDTKFADYERFYDMADEEITKTPTSGSGPTLPVICVCSKLLITLAISVFIRNAAS